MNPENRLIQTRPMIESLNRAKENMVGHPKFISGLETAIEFIEMAESAIQGSELRAIESPTKAEMATRFAEKMIGNRHIC